MTTRCPYCWYTKPDRPLSDAILQVMTEPDLPVEDYWLWMERQVKTLGTKDYSGVKIHIGRKHKDKANIPVFELSPREAAIINKTDKIKGLVW